MLFGLSRIQSLAAPSLSRATAALCSSFSLVRPTLRSTNLSIVRPLGLRSFSRLSPHASITNAFVRPFHASSFVARDNDNDSRVTRQSFVTKEATAGPPIFSGYVWLSAGAVGFSVLSLWISNELLNLSLLTMTELGFLVGGMTFAGAASLAFTVQKWFSISPESVHKLTWNRLRKDPQIYEIFGKSIQTSSFRAYMSRGGLAKFNVLGYQISSRPSLDLLFEISGTKHKGMVYVVVEKKRSEYLYQQLFVHIPATGQRVVLEGDGKVDILQGVIYF
eukprot:TRINITY_DN4559_c0_g1_i3.p1 TRINITY_DN4559_c0_g1~~TRINITY_DN4559_c0_g1_i3.p1  ORF type:complete len:277 (-),score=53.29 TRINITY_DN4559_c0_g1_i3:457-1287(-)